MKQITTTLIFTFTLLSGYAQSDLLITHNEKVVGKSYKENSEIKATENIFPERIAHIYIDTVSNRVTVQLRGLTRNEKYLDNTGKIILYDLMNKNVKWSQKINYSQDYIEQYNDKIIETSHLKSYGKNIENGGNKWEVQNQVYYVNPKQNIGIGYKCKSFAGFNTLQGINLNTGEILWDKVLNGNYEWNGNYQPVYMWDGAFRLNDSVSIVVVRGLHAINLKTGKGWDYDVATTAFDALKGYVREIMSNILVDSTSIFFASRTQIARLDLNGEIEWSQPFPPNFGSKSYIFIKDSLLYVVNTGCAISGQKQISYGKPFVAAFELITGKQSFLSFAGGSKEQINGYKVKRDTILLIYKDKISKYLLSDGEQIAEKEIEPDSANEMRASVGGLVFVKTDSTYKSLKVIDSTNIYIWTEAGKILTLNNKLEVLNRIEDNQIYICYLKTTDYKFIAKGNETIVIDKTGKVVAELQASSNSRLIGSKLYDFQNQSFIEIDVNELMKGQTKVDID